jgi:hypothetical protein
MNSGPLAPGDTFGHSIFDNCARVLDGTSANIQQVGCLMLRNMPCANLRTPETTCTRATMQSVH